MKNPTSLSPAKSRKSGPNARLRRPGRPPKSDKPGEAREKLLASAEALFAERGFYGVTTREVASHAGVDDALIYYHFKNKRALFDAVLERRATVVHKVRHDSLVRYAAAAGRQVTVEGAIAAFINPLINLSQTSDVGWKRYFALVAQLDNTPWGGEIIHRHFDPVVHELLDLIKKALPATPQAELYWAYNFLAGSMMLALSETARVDLLSAGQCRASDLNAVRNRLLAYCAGGFRATIAAQLATHG